jgi:integrase/recombinase XerD
MKPLAVAASDYLALRRGLGFKLRHETWWLPDFVAYLDSHGSATITTELALRWAQQPPGADPSWWAKKLGAIRRFARYHQASDPRTEVPSADLLPYRGRRLDPHIYSDAELTALLQAARRLPDPLTSATYTTILGLLAATGMRVGEALQLDEEDVDWRQAVLTLRHTKFAKTRLVPVHKTTLISLHHYVQMRNRLCPRRATPSFFASRVGTRVFHQKFHHVFLQLVRQTGIDRGLRRRPRLHDLRHTFAVRTLRDWYRAGADVEQRLPWLSTYLGHACPTATYWYLTATPQLLSLAAHRLERAWRAQP